MKNQQQQIIQMTTLQVIISIIILIILIIIFAIQMSILIAYYFDQKVGRCIYKDGDDKCYCIETTKNSCNKLKGKFNNELTCNDVGAIKDCKSVQK